MDNENMVVRHMILFNKHCDKMLAPFIIFWLSLQKFLPSSEKKGSQKGWPLVNLLILGQCNGESTLDNPPKKLY